jgi:hypothetical protein
MNFGSMHENTVLLFEKYARQYFRPNISVLEIGPDDQFALRRAIADASVKWDG